MLPPFNLKGYTASDPLDRVSPRTGLLVLMGVTALITCLLLYFIVYQFNLVAFQSKWVMLAEVVGYTFLIAPVVFFLRKSSSVVPYLLVFLPLYLLDLYIQAHFRDLGKPALWTYVPGTFIDAIHVLPLRFFITLSFDGLLIGPICLWLARVGLAIFGHLSTNDVPRQRFRKLGRTNPSRSPDGMPGTGF
ncbi:hypothetical protein GO730_20220 [Spirosoma sp. HMF3257]|uniref:Uncharacterized protein n=1 Tax=Spirosoma telluris TaxID=2183553 RepID=A0A327NT30_9BACT|nr:hypothetical protein [Spirosoma telluris]RAI75898.1 hypothetical protein HMF3257_20150 [Spirosoma telluris]